MGYDLGDSFPIDFAPNGIPFGSKSNEKLSPRSYPIQFERKWNTSFLSVPARETGESQHHRGKVMGNMARTSWQYGSERIKGAFKGAHPTWTCVNLSDSL